MLEDVLGPLHPGDRLFVGVLEDIGQCHLASDDNPQVGRRGAEGKVRPGAADELSTETVVGGGRGRGDNAAFVPIDARPREARKDGDENEGWRDVSDAHSGESEVVSEGVNANVGEGRERRAEGRKRG